MKKVFLINYKVDNDSIVKDRIKSLGPWLNYFPNSWLVESDLSAKQIYEKLSDGYQDERFLIVKIDTKEKWGYLPKSAWEWFSNRKNL